MASLNIIVKNDFDDATLTQMLGKLVNVDVEPAFEVA
jgi:hypothetical protein